MKRVDSATTDRPHAHAEADALALELPVSELSGFHLAGFHPPTFHPMGDGALTVCFARAYSPQANAQVRGLAGALGAASKDGARAMDGVIEIVPTLRSLTVIFDPLRTDHATIEGAVRDLLRASSGSPGDKGEAVASRLHDIPVCYGPPSFSPDVMDVAAAVALHPDDVVQRHAAQVYDVLMVGFLPGLPYLGPLDAAIDRPRLSTPRLRVPAGSVAIAAGMSVIYPLESPGGWHIIGRTPERLFDPSRRQPALIAAGDRVRFHAITEDEFHASQARHGGENN